MRPLRPGWTQSWLCLLLVITLLLATLLLSGQKNPESTSGFSLRAFAEDGEEKKIALTFDDGPHKTLTPQILDLLAVYRVPASFFVIGVNAERFPDLVAREQAEGHEIGMHTYTHPHLRTLSAAEIETELVRSETLLSEILGGVRPTLFRPPEGVCTEAVKAAATNRGCRLILWSVDTEDWTHRSPDAIVEAVLREVRPGSIILMHDFISGSSPTPEALRRLLPALLDEGYTFVTVSELLGE